MIEKLLIANRGEIARRIQRTCCDLGIATVAVHSDPDRYEAFVREADEAVAIGGSAPRDSYLRGDLIVEAALAVGADAVHPGFGFLSENADFARRCLDAGLTFVGPSPEVIQAMGSKVNAKQLAAKAGVPILPSVALDCDVESGDLVAMAEEIGLPILVKASFGGGGRGMRIVRNRDDLAASVAESMREATSAFGDGTVFLERFVERSRHVEIQIVGDGFGSVAHLFERECSIQRRHQKIVEECPSPAVSADLRARMATAAVELGRSIGYVGAGTVEFLVTPHMEFFFLEVNTRLQVEHPVTEAVTGLDIVALQLQVAGGEALPPEVLAPRSDGHAIEARLYAEDPAAGFAPTTGTVARFYVPSGPGVRVEAGVEAGSQVGVHYDGMLAKIIVHDRTRAVAARRLSRVLEQSEIHGVTTNRDLLVRILRHPEFAAAQTDTDFLVRHAGLLTSGDRALAVRLHAVAGALALQARRRADARVLRPAPSGWRNVVSAPRRVVLDGVGGSIEVTYRLGRDVVFAVDGTVLDGVEPAGVEPDLVELSVERVMRRFRIHVVGDDLYVDSPLGSDAFTIRSPFPGSEVMAEPGSLLAPMPGVVVRIDVEQGAAVTVRQVLVVMEAMKMEHQVRAPTDGDVVRIPVRVGQTVDAGQALVVLEPR